MMSNECRKSFKLSTLYRNQGNSFYIKSHDDETHLRALSLYCKSAAFALENSEELALVYGNRSALLLHMQKYKECLIDIDMALKICTSHELENKLLFRKKSCLDKMKKSEIQLKQDMKSSNDLKVEQLSDKLNDSITLSSLQNFNLEKLTLPKIKRSKKVPCLAESLSLNYSKKYGRYIVTNQDIPPGQIIAVEEAYVASPKTEKLYVVCSHCLNTAWNGIPCNNCVFAIYCSQECKQNACQEYHDVECCIIHFLFDLKILANPNTILSYQEALRIFLKGARKDGLGTILNETKTHSNRIPKIDSFSCQYLQSCCSLASNSAKTKPQIEATEKMMSWLVELIDDHTSFFDDIQIEGLTKIEILSSAKRLLYKLENIVHVNSYCFQGGDCHDYNEDNTSCGINCEFRGVIIAPCCSLFNHSCNPNVGRVFAENRKIVLYTTYSIKKGEQLFVNYGPELFTEREGRREYLQQLLGFSCNCQPCAENWPTLKYNWKCETEINDKICEEYNKFCTKKQLSPILFFKSSEKWSCDQETMKHVIKLLEITCKYLDGYEAAARSLALRTHLQKCFVELYGSMDERVRKC